MNLNRIARRLLVLSCFALTMGCDADDQIVTYQAPKDQPVKPLRPLTPPAAAPLPQAAQSPLAWTVPDGWKSVEGNSMSTATFQVSDVTPAVKCTITPLPMIENALQANVNRWEGQLGLAPTEKEQLSQVAKPVQVGDLTVHVVDLSNDQNAILGAVIEKDQIWFIKMTGPKDIVGAQREKFDGFVRSLKFTDQPTPPEAAPTDQAPPVAPAQADENRAVTWTLPTGWQEVPSPSAMRLATIKAGDAEVAASKLVAKGWGSLLDNLNRWRGQIGLQPIDDPAKQPVVETDVNGAKWTTYDLAGEQKRMIVSYVTAGENVFFFRLTGDPAAVEAQKPAFTMFIQSIRVR